MPQSQPDRMEDVKLPDISNSRSIDHNQEDSKITERAQTLNTDRILDS